MSGYRSINVIINALLLNDHFSGVEYSTENLLKSISQIENDDIFIKTIVSKEYSGDLTTQKNFSLKSLNFSTRNRLRRILYENLSLQNLLEKGKIDLYHSTGYVLPLFNNFPSVLTIHDLIALDFPQYCKRSTAAYYSLALPLSIHKATRIIAVSNCVKSDILRRFNILEEKIAVVYHGVEQNFKKVACEQTLKRVSLKYRLPEKFILFVGNLEPKKNLKRLIDAYFQLKQHTSIIHKLVIVGQPGWRYDNVVPDDTNDFFADVIFTGYVPRVDLPAIYTLADLAVMPSLYEGFGLPALEAMSCETPLLISDAGALPEIAPHVYPRIKPTDTNDIANKISLYLENDHLRKKNVADGSVRVKNFSWDRAASETLNIYREVCHTANHRYHRSSQKTTV